MFIIMILWIILLSYCATVGTQLHSPLVRWLTKVIVVRADALRM